MIGRVQEEVKLRVAKHEKKRRKTDRTSTATRIAGRIAAEHPQTFVLIPVISAVVGARRVVENQDTTATIAASAAAIIGHLFSSSSECRSREASPTRYCRRRLGSHARLLWGNVFFFSSSISTNGCKLSDKTTFEVHAPAPVYQSLVLLYVGAFRY